MLHPGFRTAPGLTKENAFERAFRLPPFTLTQRVARFHAASYLEAWVGLRNAVRDFGPWPATPVVAQADFHSLYELSQGASYDSIAPGATVHEVGLDDNGDRLAILLFRESTSGILIRYRGAMRWQDAAEITMIPAPMELSHSLHKPRVFTATLYLQMIGTGYELRVLNNAWADGITRFSLSRSRKDEKSAVVSLRTEINAALLAEAKDWWRAWAEMPIFHYVPGAILSPWGKLPDGQPYAFAGSLRHASHQEGDFSTFCRLLTDAGLYLFHKVGLSSGSGIDFFSTISPEEAWARVSLTLDSRKVKYEATQWPRGVVKTKKSLCKLLIALADSVQPEGRRSGDLSLLKIMPKADWERADFKRRDPRVLTGGRIEPAQFSQLSAHQRLVFAEAFAELLPKIFPPKGGSLKGRDQVVIS
jgi:hypothetical protein